MKFLRKNWVIILVTCFKGHKSLRVLFGSVRAPLPIYDLKSWVGYRNQFKHSCSSVTKTLSFTQADLVWLEPFLRFSPSLVGHFQTHILGHCYVE